MSADHMARFDHFYTVVTTAQHDRDKRRNITPSGMPGWVEYEIRNAWLAVNAWRTSSGFPPVTLADVERVERMAAGHIDYTKKFALYCADLAGADQSQVRP